MNRWNGKVAIVTGASVGIGAAITRELVQYGIKVIGCGRDFDRLLELGDTLKPAKPGLFKPVQCDVTNEEDILNLFNVSQEFGGVDICINNAGMAIAKPILESTGDDLMKQMNVNVIAVALCCREAVKQMKTNGVNHGRIININSIAGHRATPSPVPFYTATKYALNALTIGLNHELSQMGSGIKVAQISPGIVQTEIARRSCGGNPMADELYKTLTPLQGKDIADAVVYMLSAP